MTFLFSYLLSHLDSEYSLEIILIAVKHGEWGT